MGKLFDHSNCPNPVQWGSSPVKTVYIRDTEGGKTTWKPVGWICTGCGVFRSKSGWFPSGKAEPICDPWKPSRTPVESILEGEDSAHDDDDKAPEDMSRVTISRLQKALGLSRQEVISRVESGEIPVEKDQYRHWSVPYSWLEKQREACHAEV